MRYVTTAERIGMQKGMEKGKEEGREEGERKILRLQLEQKFGPLNNQVLQQLEKANPTLLEKIAQKLLSAKQIEDIFASDAVPA